MGWPLAQPHTTKKTKAIRPKQHHRAMFNPPAVNWEKTIITWPFFSSPGSTWEPEYEANSFSIFFPFSPFSLFPFYP
jgi:hypothetical protein